MKTGIILIVIVTIAAYDTLGAKEEKPFRDPFWPIGYSPAPPVSEKPVEEAKPVIKVDKPKPPPPPKPVTAEEWEMARKLLNITGYALADNKNKDGTRTTSIVIINRNHYKTGDVIKLIHKDIEFIWKVGDIRNNSVDLIQESANRLKGTSSKGNVPIAPPAGEMR